MCATCGTVITRNTVSGKPFNPGIPYTKSINYVRMTSLYSTR